MQFITNQRIKLVFCASLAMGIVGMISPQPTLAQSNGPYNPTVGKLHPDFSMPSIADRKPIKLSDFRGKKMLLFHFASW